MHSARSSETSVSYQNATRLHNPEHLVTAPLRWDQHGPLKIWYPDTTLNGVTTQRPRLEFFISFGRN